jgi:hypothetical protein
MSATIHTLPLAADAVQRIADQHERKLDDRFTAGEISEADWHEGRAEIEGWVLERLGLPAAECGEGVA